MIRAVSNVLVAMTGLARAEVHSVEPGGDHLIAALALAGAGDTLHLGRGIHYGPIIVDKALILVIRNPVRVA